MSINNDGQVETMSPDGRNRRVISDESGALLFPTWSPTGDSIAAIGGHAVYQFADLPELDEQALYTSRTQNPFYLYWSPDGRSLTFLANHPSDIGLYLAPADDGDAPRRLAQGNMPFWSQC